MKTKERIKKDYIYCVFYKELRKENCILSLPEKKV